MGERDDLGRASLLWPEGARDAAPPAGWEQAVADLDVRLLAQVIAGAGGGDEGRTLSLMSQMTTDAGVIRYRQELYDDLASRDALRAGLRALIPSFTAFGRERVVSPGRDSAWEDVAYAVVDRLRQLQVYLDVVAAATRALAENAPASPALGRIRAALEAEARSAAFRQLAAEVPEMCRVLDERKSLVLAVNLTSAWQPESATVLSIGQPVAGRATALMRLLEPLQDAERGVTPLRRAYAQRGRSTPMLPDWGPVLHRELLSLLKPVLGAFLARLRRFNAVTCSRLARLGDELAFYLGAVECMGRLARAGLPLARAEARAPDERASTLTGLYDASLALRLLEAPTQGQPRAVVPSDAGFGGRDPRVWLLTGPNSGGKTTYMRAVGLAHILFAAGLPVPASRARLSPVDAVLTDFDRPEVLGVGAGAFEQRLVRLKRLLDQAGEHSLLLLNEPLAGTSRTDALPLAADLLKALRHLGARCVYVTHLRELAADLGEINREPVASGSTAGSLVAGGDDPAQALWLAGGSGAPGEGGAPADPAASRYHVRPGLPPASAAANRIAFRHGLTLEQLREEFAARRARER